MSRTIFTGATLALAVGCAASALAAENAEEIIVVGTTPGAGQGVEANKLPFSVQLIDSEQLEQAQSLDLTDYLNSHAGSVSINSAQNNPLQPDLQFRGFSASPLLGLPQGVAVYQNGVRINEPLGDSVNWDLLPESAVSSMQLISGADPVFGLNTLGGALAIEMKNGFNYEGTRAEVGGGSWGRMTTTLESGGTFLEGSGGEWGYYANLNYFEEDGWRDLSPSEASNFYGSLSWRDGMKSALNFNLQLAESELYGNGAVPVGLLAIDRAEIFTAPDITENDMQMFSIDGSHFISDNIQFAGNVFWRKNDTDSFNGDGSEFELCNYAGGAQSLFEEAEAIEDGLENDLGIELDDICAGEDPAITGFAELENYIENAALTAGLDPEAYELEDASDEISGTGILSDEAINNISERSQESQGFDSKLIFLDDLFGQTNHLTVGLAWFKGAADFNAIVELSEIDPLTRNTQGLGLGSYFDEGATNVSTETEILSFYFSDTLDLSERLSLTLAGRYNDVDVSLRDQSGERPELNGDHNFKRFNPSVGLSYMLTEESNIYASYSESSRVPTPIELACNEGVFEVAREYALARGDDPDDIDFECRLPNAFLADPPLDDVVTKSLEAGIRGSLNDVRYHLGVFHSVNENDILFQSTGRATGLFANVDETRRMGVEGALNGSIGKFNWFANYTWLEATFEDDFDVLSPNHPGADAEGLIAVQKGDHMPGLPEHTLKLGGDYFFNDRFSLGGEVVYNSEIYLRGDETNSLDSIDGYALVNVRAGYRIGEQLEIFVRATNLFDKDYENFGLLGEEPDEVIDGLADERPIFLGPGSPRAAWIGVSYNF